MQELYAGEPVEVNNESANGERLVHQEALGLLFDGSLGQGRSSRQIPRPPCTSPYTATPLNKP
jgi:hypothetical protein